MANTKLILTQEVSGLGSAGDIVEVRAGYARNYLLPNGVAKTWTAGAEREVERQNARRKSRQIATLEEAQAQREVLQSAPVGVAVRAGENGRLFGGVTPTHIAEAVKTDLDQTIAKPAVEIPTPIRSLGEHEAKVRLHADVVATVKVNVRPAKV